MTSALQTLERLRTLPFFTVNDVAKLVPGKTYYPKIVLHRLLKKGLVRRICRGKYTMQDDPFAFASSLYPPAYLGLWSALRFHDMTTQLPRDTFIFTAKKRKTMRFNDSEIILTPTRHMWGFERRNYRGFQVTVSDKEKTLIDCLLSRRVPVSEVFEAMAEIDGKRLADYAIKTGNKSLAQRLGYLMERAGLREAESLLPLRGTNYTTLDAGRRNGKTDRKWRLIVNTVLE